MDVFNVFGMMFTGFVRILQQVHIFGTDLWNFTLGMAVFIIAIKVIKKLFGHSGGKEK